MTPALELAHLSHKYERLIALRYRLARDGAPAPAAELKALAAEFPGSLRELDRSPMEVLEDRRDDLERARAGGPHAPWIAVVARYHHALRELLRSAASSRKTGRGGRPTLYAVDAVARELGVETAFVREALGLRGARR